MNKQLIKDGFIWGLVLWLIGYILGIVFFIFVPKSMIGWVIMPIGTVIALWVLLKKVKSKTITYFLKLAVIWTVMTILFDYLFIVQLFKAGGGYYKMDVYVYYLLTFTLPLLIGWRKQRV